MRKLRIKINICIYDPKGLIGKNEIDAMYNTAKIYWGKVRLYLEKINPQLKLFKQL
jgi:hypothetical protein